MVDSVENLLFLAAAVASYCPESHTPVPLKAYSVLSEQWSFANLTIGVDFAIYAR